jgi:hypothetical protein
VSPGDGPAGFAASCPVARGNIDPLADRGGVRHALGPQLAASAPGVSLDRKFIDELRPRRVVEVIAPDLDFYRHRRSPPGLDHRLPARRPRADRVRHNAADGEPRRAGRIYCLGDSGKDRTTRGIDLDQRRLPAGLPMPGMW